jgi:hypothetical protein
VSGSPINAWKTPADMRDIHALQVRLFEQGEESARQTLAAHRRTLDVIAANEASAKVHRADLQGELAEIRTALKGLLENQRVMLDRLGALVVVPADKDVARASVPAEVPAAAGWLARAARVRAMVARRLDGPVTMRAVVYGFAIAGVGASLTSCLAYLAR